MALNLYLNDLFGLGRTLLEQFTGVAIGGFFSAQDADITLLRAESMQKWVQLVPRSVKLCRFRDNGLCLCPKSEVAHWLPYIKHTLANIYNMPISVEQVGCSLSFPELQIEIQDCHIEWGLKNKVLLLGLTPVPPIRRYPDAHEPHAAQVVHGLACALVNKATAFSTQSLSVRNRALWPAIFPTSSGNSRKMRIQKRGGRPQCAPPTSGYSVQT